MLLQEGPTHTSRPDVGIRFMFGAVGSVIGCNKSFPSQQLRDGAAATAAGKPWLYTLHQVDMEAESCP